MAEGPRLDRAGREYARAIEKQFRRYLDRPINLSAKDIEAVKRWWEEGITLDAVVMGIDSFFYRNRDDPKKLTKIHSLRYCEDDVRTAWEIVRASQIGDRRGEGVEDPGRLSRTLDALHAALGRGIDHLEAAGFPGAAAIASEVREAVEALRGEAERAVASGGAPDASDLERHLRELDGRLAGALRSALSEREIAALHRESHRTLAAHRERMADAAYAKTVELLEQRLLRERFKVPRLSLYAY